MSGTGKYEFKPTCTTMKFTVVNDSCVLRRSVLAHDSFKKV